MDTVNFDWSWVILRSRELSNRGHQGGSDFVPTKLGRLRVHLLSVRDVAGLWATNATKHLDLSGWPSGIAIAPPPAAQ